MSGISISVSGQEAVNRAMALLTGIEGGFEKALRSATNKAANRLKSSSAEAVRKRYAISVSGIKANENVQIEYSASSGAQAYVKFAGSRIPLYRFDGASPGAPVQDTSRRVPVLTSEGWKLLHPAVSAAGHVLNSTSPYAFDNAFVACLGGHVGIFERTGGLTSGGKDELRELYSPAVPQMVGSEEVREALADKAMEAFEKDLDHSVMAILNGYMR